MSLLHLLASVAVSSSAPATWIQRCSTLSKVERQQIDAAEKNRSASAELVIYAKTYCVTLAEAKRRLDVQVRDAVGPETEPGGPPQPAADGPGRMEARLRANESSTFAGLWIEHQPSFRVVVAFTRDGAATLSRYTNDPLFVAIDRGGPTALELEHTRDQVMADLQRLGARPSLAMADGRQGEVEIYVAGSLDSYNAAVARGEVKRPVHVRIEGRGPLPHAAPALPAGWRKVVRAFPQVSYAIGGVEPAILRIGTMVLEGGCLKLKGERHNPVIVWPSEAALDLTKPGKVRVLNRLSGEVIEPNTRIRLGGSMGTVSASEQVVGSDPACPGPYVAIGNFGTMERIDRQMLEGRAKSIEFDRKVSAAEALRLARAERLREERYEKLSVELLSKAPETFAAIYPYQGRATLKVAGEPVTELRRLIPADLRPFVKAERVPRSLAALKIERQQFEKDLEQLGLAGGAYEDVEQGRIVIQSNDLPAVGRAAISGHLRLPVNARVQTDGGMPEGAYSEEATQATNRRLEAAPDWAEMRNLVEQTKVPGFLVTYKEGEPDRPPTRAQSLEITRFLIALGFTAADLRALHEEGQFPARAFVEQNGRGTIVNRSMLARDVVAAEVLDVRPELLGDGYRSTVRLRVSEALKGDLAVGEIVRLRLVSGVGSDGKLHQSNDEPIIPPGLPGSVAPGSRWLVLLSQGMRARQAALVGQKTGTGRFYGLLYGAWPIVGGEVAGTYSEAGLGSIAEVRRQLVPVDAAFDRATAKLGKQLMRRALP